MAPITYSLISFVYLQHVLDENIAKKTPGFEGLTDYKFLIVQWESIFRPLEAEHQTISIISTDSINHTNVAEEAPININIYMGPDNPTPTIEAVCRYI